MASYEQNDTKINAVTTKSIYKDNGAHNKRLAATKVLTE